MSRKNIKSVKVNKKSIFNILIFVILLYFVFHSIYGSRGVIAYFKMHAELERSKNSLEMLRHERLEVENRTKLLRPGSLDRDMLDEKVRSILGVANPSEKVFSTQYRKEDTTEH